MKQFRIAILIIGLFSLAGCFGSGGGSDGGETQPPPTGSSDWDSMVWDQDDWA